MWLLFAGAVALFLCGALLGYRFAWMDAYTKGRADALKPLRPIPWPPTKQ